MARRMSNRDRLERMREEADATAAEKKRDRIASGKVDRFKYVWAVKDATGKIESVYPYSRKPAAEAEAERLKKANRRHYLVSKHKVPFDA